MESNAQAPRRDDLARHNRIPIYTRAAILSAERSICSLPPWVLVTLVLGLYSLLTIAVIERGFLEYNADGYTRIIRGYEWLRVPRWEVGVWLPLQTWLFGVGLLAYDSLAVTPRAINFILSLATLLSLYVIGSATGGKIAGLIASGLGATFPWMVWFGVSGMSEPLFHAALAAGAAGFVHWTSRRDHRYLLVAATGIGLSTMVRYEGWFYAVVFAVLVLGLAYNAGDLDGRMIALAVLPLLFPLLWVQQYWQVFGDPLGFARDISAIKEELQPENRSAGLLRRLSVYPYETFRLAPWLALLSVLGAGFALYRRVPWWPLIALIAGQAALLVTVSAAFSNLGPGAERYLLSNFILLFPVLSGAILLISPVLLRAALVFVVALVALRLLPTLLNPPTLYPGEEVRIAAEQTGELLDRLQSEPGAILLLPPPPADEFNASYAFRILSDHPDAWIITSDPQLFAQLVRDNAAPLWVVDLAVELRMPDADEIVRSGRFVIGIDEDHVGAIEPGASR